MRIYQASTNGLWIGILFFIVLIFSVVALGGFLLGTPLGLALLTLLIVRHYYKKHQRKKYQEEFESTYGKQGFDWFGTNAGTNRQEAADQSEDSVNADFSEDFASRYKQAEQDHMMFSREDKYNAVDVEFKEL